MNRKLSLLERILVFAITFFVVVFVLSTFRIWQLDWQDYLIKAGKWPELIFILAIVSAITLILVKLLQWEYRIEAKPKKPRK